MLACLESRLSVTTIAFNSHKKYPMSEAAEHRQCSKEQSGRAVSDLLSYLFSGLIWRTTVEISDCFFAIKNRDFVRCGLQTMSPLFFEKARKKGLSISLSHSITDGATNKSSNRGIVRELFYKGVCLF